MVKFVVTYRAKDGSLKEIGYEAEDRKALFKQLSADGISAVRVREGVIGKSPRRTMGMHGIRKLLYVFGFVVFAVILGVVFLAVDNSSADTALEPKKPRSIKKTKRETIEKQPKSSRAEKIKKIKSEVDDLVKPFIKTADTNNVFKLGVPPLDPDDPDNALRTQTMTEVQMLIGIVPGEPMPPVPFSFMVEDAVIEDAAKRGETVVTVENGNKRFLDEMEKWKITIKDTDSEQRAAKKMDLVNMQLELMDGMEQGVSVNDSIRAAWEFRKNAYEKRSDLMKVIRELHDADPDVEVTKTLIDKANEGLESDGIKSIKISEIIPDFEEEDL